MTNTNELLTADIDSTEKEMSQHWNESSPLKDGWEISVSNGHSGYGVYAHMTDYPDEGAILLLQIADARVDELINVYKNTVRALEHAVEQKPELGEIQLIHDAMHVVIG